MTWRELAIWNAEVRWMASSARFVAAVNAVLQADRYVSSRRYHVLLVAAKQVPRRDLRKEPDRARQRLGRRSTPERWYLA
jgi:hypothetical protein